MWRRYEGVDVPGGAAHGFDVSDTPSVDAMWAHVHSSFRAGQHHTSLIGLRHGGHLELPTLLLKSASALCSCLFSLLGPSHAIKIVEGWRWLVPWRLCYAPCPLTAGVVCAAPDEDGKAIMTSDALTILLGMYSTSPSVSLLQRAVADMHEVARSVRPCVALVHPCV